MSEHTPEDDGGDSVEEDIKSVYGEISVETNPSRFALKKEFFAWHHPVKQVVRKGQWANLTEQLIREHREPDISVLRYFTLPGEDLLDVRALADVCLPRGIQIEFFGFNSAPDPGRGEVASAALRQAGVITSNALVLPDRLEDIANRRSQAAFRLSQCLPFDVVNIDACDHLAFRPSAQSGCTFDAIRALLNHQMDAKKDWMLFITSRADPDRLGEPAIEFQRAIDRNLEVSADGFGPVLAEAIEADPKLMATELAKTWTSRGHKFLKLYSIGVGKFLLQFFHNQPNLPAKVRLVSACAYRVHGNEPDMLSLAFRISPERRQPFPPDVGGAVIIPSLEPERAIHVARRAQKLRDLDRELRERPEVSAPAIQGSAELLRAAGYDIPAWRKWLAEHPERPMTIV